MQSASESGLRGDIVTRVISDPAFAKQYLASQGLEPILGTPEQFAAFIRSETVKWGKIVKDANIKVTKE
jgi:tripartite-type tricarboxylate transporter receptor subunit TctC